jgi:hypothetical protein
MPVFNQIFLYTRRSKGYGFFHSPLLLYRYTQRGTCILHSVVPYPFSEENNAVAQRELLVREGTARFADTAGEKDHHLQKMLQKHQENSRGISYGTIPYLGTFLTDLIMIDTAIPDVVSEGLINFDKRRKEFEVLAQVSSIVLVRSGRPFSHIWD